MPDNSPILALPYIQPSQAQKHVTHNEALTRLDLLVQLSVSGFAATTPPVDPAAGDTHALGTAPTDAWAGQGDMIATWRDGVWHFVAPQVGWRAWGRAEAELRIWDGTAWGVMSFETSNLDGLGIGTTADATNRLAVRAAATLLSHAGAGHQLKINKNAAADTASLLFQTSWSGRAEMGLAGNDAFSIKVSPDGSTWTEALRAASTGTEIAALENTPIGQATPAAGAFTSLTGSGNLSIDGSTLFVNAANNRIGIGTSNPGGTLEVRDRNNGPAISRVGASHAAFTSTLNFWFANRLSSADYDFLHCRSGGGAGDLEFRLRADGNGTCDGAWTGGGADYAEYFEWADGNPKAEDRRGLSVVLDGDQIREAKPGDDPIGVISGNPSVVGDAAPFRWAGKYRRDDFGTTIMEDYEVVSWTGSSGNVPGEGTEHSYATDAVPKGVKVPKDAARVTQQRRQLNPKYDPARKYIPREERPDWDTVGLMGKLRLRKGQATGGRWIRMRQISGKVEEWLVR